MAEVILKGRRFGKQITIHQWGPDWITDQDNDVYSPLSLKLNDQEMKAVRADPSGLLDEFVLFANGRFSKK